MTTPALSTVLITRHGIEPLERTLAALRAQTVAERIEAVIVSIDAPEVDASARALGGIGSVRAVRVEGGGEDAIGAALAAGVEAAGSELVAFGEDHAFPASDWAEATVAAHGRGPAAIAPAIANANPGTVASWANVLLAYGQWLEPAPTGPVALIPGSNSSFRRSALRDLDGELPALLAREGGLTEALREAGHEPVLAPEARVHHENPSRLRSTATLRINAGRLYAARRSRDWPRWRRLVYAAASPLIPPLRFVRLARDFADRGLRLGPRVLAGLGLGTALDGAGQLLGFARGEGDAAEVLVGFELERERHLAGRDRRASAGAS